MPDKLSNLRPALGKTLAPPVTVKKRTNTFYNTPAWKSLVARLIATRGRRCETKTTVADSWEGCGREEDESGRAIRIFGDHIVEIQDGGAALDENNVQLLCGSCHSAKTAAARAKRLGKW